ncbi:T9SS type A sorting domain-containing protein [Porphyromonas gulae]|uniref:T9SS type A sorting domain-containing protein n=1 Tax=Porphyromonas gulae TaxID=111105 RepID=UPI0009B83ACC|nr:T9SS type A sorting domain-containing protein [Porphyromonas gulae]
MKRIKLLLGFALFFQLANAQQSGDLDPTFGTNGVVQTPIGNGSFIVDEVRNVTIQPNGKIIAMGSTRNGTKKHVAYVRYNPDGSLDQSFGNGGKQIFVPTSLYGNFATAAATLSDGKIISCGYVFDSDNTICQPLLIRMNDDGTLDTSFGNNGIVLADFPYSTLPEKMVLQKDGKMLLVGYYHDNMMTLRYNPDGSIDKTYGIDGVCEIVIEGSANSSFAKAIALQEDNKVVIVGMYGTHPDWKWVIARINENGSLDNSFGENGLKTMSIGSGHDFATAVQIQEDGKIVVAGHSWVASIPTLQYDLIVLRLNQDGELDNTFGESGIFKKNVIDGGATYVDGIVLSPEGNIYVAFNAVKNSISDLGLLSVDKNGKLNTSFGGNGYTVTDLSEAADEASAIVMQADGKIVLGASSFSATTGTPFVLLRYLTDVPSSVLPMVGEEKSFVVYPNPVKDVLNIEYEGEFGVRIFDLSGRLVLSTKNTRTIDVKALTAGSYVIELTTEAGVLAERFVKL